MDHGLKEGDAAGPTAGGAARGNNTAAAAATTAASSSSGGVVVQVREKKGPLRAAIPYMPFPVAVLCLFLNTFVPGLVAEIDLQPPGKHFCITLLAIEHQVLFNRSLNSLQNFHLVEIQNSFT
ncbi:protein stum homolog isoform X2 [Pantherophis guttatus]|uniref:Protein stum homolog isoform X2 n=1 Tax=Pantherophis guttatus TaxID=94885 RepID=A0A6P9CKQ8_PANGU|nr:protein stum homolog isoform X2 [Pantherophis guttatus]